MIFKRCYRIPIFQLFLFYFATTLSMNTAKLSNLQRCSVITFFAIVIEFMQKKIPLKNGTLFKVKFKIYNYFVSLVSSAS